MAGMFQVRTVRALHPMSSRALPCARTLALLRMPSFSTRQEASAFNQPLSFDTSSVTGMSSMFRVRSARALRPTLVGQHLPFPNIQQLGPAPYMRLFPPPSTRQGASAFNQPLSLDTSNVARMGSMFRVRYCVSCAQSL